MIHPVKRCAADAKTRRQALRARFFFALYHTSPCQYNKSRPLRGAVCLCLQKQKYVQKQIRPDRVHRAEWDSPECQGLNTIQVLANVLFPRSRTPCSAIRVCKLLCTGRGADQGGEYGGYRQSPHIPYRHGFRRCKRQSRQRDQDMAFSHTKPPFQASWAFFLRHQSETGERASLDFIIRIFIYKNNAARKFYAAFHKMIHSLAAGGLIQPPSRSRGRGGRRPSRRCCAEPRTPRRDDRGRGCQ